jgi:thiamine-phosphate pyrophosphorylase
MQPMDWSLYAITPDGPESGALLDAVGEALEGGITVLQVRRKTVSARQLVWETKRIVELCRARGVPVLVNDRVDVALVTGADGVHLGQEDLALEEMRRLGPREWIWGVSTHDPGEAEAAERSGATYVAIGPVYATPSKKTRPPGGARLVSSVRKVVRGPLIAIGGILPAHVPDVISAGADGVAVISGIFGAGAIEESVREYVAAIEMTRSDRGRNPG